MLLSAIELRHSTGQPILIGTRSLAHSERLSGLLQKHDLPHTVLNARQDEDEALVVSRAGTQGSITIATNIAGRGTDIPVSAAIAELGGLHIIVADLNDNERVDRQLVGRCARQGDPGSYEYLLSLEDPLLKRYAQRSIQGLLVVKSFVGVGLWNRLCLLACRRAQRICARTQRLTRKRVAAADIEMHKRLTFTGYKE